MRNWIPALGVVAVAGIGAAFVFSPLKDVVFDSAPPVEAMSSTVVIDQPLPIAAQRARSAAAVRPGDPPPPLPLDEPLRRHLVVIEPVPVRVPQGAVLLPAGMPVELVKDNGRTVNVAFGHKKQAATVAVPRGAVANRDEPEHPAGFSPIAVFRDTVSSVSEALYAPASSIAVEAREVGTGRGTARDFDSWTGEIGRDYFRTKGLTVTVRNLSRRPTGDFDINVY